MSKHLFLGQASHFTRKERLAHTFAFGRKKDSENLREYLAKRYNTTTNKVALTKNGRSALAIALSLELEPGSEVIINGFTCYAVVEAIKAAKMKPIFADIEPENGMNFTKNTLEAAYKKHQNAKAIIIQNSFGFPVKIKEIEKFAKDNNLKIIEDLAHCACMNYPDGREMGTIGVAAAFSFGKEKAIDTITGGALIINDKDCKELPKINRHPKFSETFRARFYPLFGAIYRTLSYAHLETPWMAFLLKTRQVERSADSKLEIDRRPPHFVAKMALKQFKKMPKNRKNLRDLHFIGNREELLKILRKNGYYFDGSWYETPISPERIYKKINFPEKECPNSVKYSQRIINTPRHYDLDTLKPALKIINEKGTQ